MWEGLRSPSETGTLYPVAERKSEEQKKRGDGARTTTRVYRKEDRKNGLERSGREYTLFTPLWDFRVIPDISGSWPHKFI